MMEYAQKLPQGFAHWLARDIYNFVEQCSTEGQEQSLSTTLATASASGGSDELPPCPKCCAKAEGRRYTGPHKREGHVCRLADDPRWRRAPNTSAAEAPKAKSDEKVNQRPRDRGDDIPGNLQHRWKMPQKQLTQTRIMMVGFSKFSQQMKMSLSSC